MDYNRIIQLSKQLLKLFTIIFNLNQFSFTCFKYFFDSDCSFSVSYLIFLSRFNISTFKNYLIASFFFFLRSTIKFYFLHIKIKHVALFDWANEFGIRKTNDYSSGNILTSLKRSHDLFQHHLVSFLKKIELFYYVLKNTT